MHYNATAPERVVRARVGRIAGNGQCMFDAIAAGASDGCTGAGLRAASLKFIGERADTFSIGTVSLREWVRAVL